MTAFLDALIESVVVGAQLEAGLSPAFVAAQSNLGPRATVILGACSRPRGSRSAAWSAEDEAFLKQTTGFLSDLKIARKLGRSTWAVTIRRKRLGLPSAMHRKEWFTGEQVALGLDIDGHQIAKLFDRRVLASHLLPFQKRRVRVIDRTVLLTWLVNPMHWCYFDPARVNRFTLAYTRRRKAVCYDEEFWAYVLRLIDRQRRRWNDEWWTPGQVARYWKLGPDGDAYVNNAIHSKALPAVRYGNWKILKSDATRPGLKLRAFSHLDLVIERRDHNADADAYIVLGHALGVPFHVLGACVHEPSKVVSERLARLWALKRIPGIIRRYNLPVGCPWKSPAKHNRIGYVFADWNEPSNRQRFPGHARMIEGLLQKRGQKIKLTRRECQFLARVQNRAADRRKDQNGKRQRIIGK